MHAVRARLCARLAPGFAELLATIGGTAATAELRYRPGGPADEGAIHEALVERRASDVARAMTGVGSHLDDVVLEVGGRDVRVYGSQGEQRSAYVALVLAEAALLGEVRASAPVLLLDDVLSELDPTRRAAVVATASRLGQTLLTATDDAVVPPGIPLRIGVRAGAVDA